MIIRIKLVTSVLCILAKFRDFLKPVIVLKIYDICRSSFDINRNLMFEAVFPLKPCIFLIVLLET